MDEFFSAGPLTGALTGVDILIVCAAVALLFVIAWVAGRREEGTDDFLMGGRSVPTAIACLSFVATEVSAMTIIGVPEQGFATNWNYIEMFFGSAAARVVVAFLFIPVFYRINCTSIYQFLGQRFGAATQYAGSAFFFVTRLLASGVRLYAACLGVSVIMGWSIGQAVLLFSVVSIVFIAIGGIKAVVWNGAYQAIMFYVCGLAVVAYVVSTLQGSVAQAWQMAESAGRTTIFDFSADPGKAMSFWAGTLNGFFVGLAVFGADQELMQRLLTVKTRRRSQGAILATIGAALPLTVIYLAVGTAIFVFYQQHPQAVPVEKAKEVLSHFVRHEMPMGLKGLVLATIVLASIDSPLMSLASSFVTDIYRPLIRRHASDRHYLWVSRGCVVVAGMILAVIAVGCSSFKDILFLGFHVFGVTGGSILGVFLLGLLTRRRANRANVVAMIFTALAMLALLILSNESLFAPNKPPVGLAWSWLIVIGTGMTFGLAWLLSFVLDREDTNGNHRGHREHGEKQQTERRVLAASGSER